MTPLLPRWRTATLAITVALALTAGVAACSSGAKSSSGSSAVGQRAPAAPQDGAQGAVPPAAAPDQNKAGAPGQNNAGAPDQNQADAGGNAQAAPGDAAGRPGQVPSFQRSIIYTGSITLRVPDVDTAATQLEALTAGAGGFVGGDDRTVDADRSTATLVLRIPAERVGGMLDDISSRLGGKEQSRKVSTQDVTQNLIDLDARIQSQQASVDRVRALLAKAQSLSDITSIESQLAQREADLESMEAQKRNLDDLTTLSTITVTLLGPEAVRAQPKPKPKPQPGFWGGLKGGWHALAGVARVVAMVVGALLPFAVPIGALVLLVFWLRRRRRAPEVPVAPPVPPAAAPPAAPPVDPAAPR